MLKQELREKYKAKRKLLTPNEVDHKSLKISNQVLDIPIWESLYFHIFLSIEKQKEVNTEFILPILKGKDKNIAISKTNFAQKSMRHYALMDSTRLVINQMGIPEPDDGFEIPSHKIDVIFIPLLAFDKNGNRVGYGGGFYDRFLQECRPDVIKIGLSFFPPEPAISDVSTTDIPLDFCATPEALYKFKS